MSDMNRRTGATDVWVIKDVRLSRDLLVARRQRLTGSWLSGPWQSSYHVQDLASNQWLSSQPDQPALAFAPQEVDFKRLRLGRPHRRTVAFGPIQAESAIYRSRRNAEKRR